MEVKPMPVVCSIIGVIGLAGCGLLAGRWEGLRLLTGVIVPYAAVTIFLGGVCYRVIGWALAPVPFRIPTTCGQQKSLPWLGHARLDNPASTPGVIGRMVLEILFFRSLFRYHRTGVDHGQVRFGAITPLWLGAIVFHYSLLVIVLRHLRLFTQPAPAFVIFLQRADGFFQIGAPGWYLTDVAILVALSYLLLRRLYDPLVRYISQFTDYFALLLLFGIALTGVLLRYIVRTDVAAAKQLALGLVTFQPHVPDALGSLFFAHLLLVSVLAAYFPFSKLMHMGGVFLSPTRNLANTNRMRRHINEWNAPVKTHTYAEWEEEFREKLLKAGIPLDTQDAGTVNPNRA
jgi:nitrate reductase gamma subunit